MEGQTATEAENHSFALVRRKTFSRQSCSWKLHFAKSRDIDFPVFISGKSVDTSAYDEKAIGSDWYFAQETFDPVDGFFLLKQCW